MKPLRYRRPAASIEDRFWAKVEKTDTCWIWTGNKTKAGYGLIWSLEARTQIYAHRLTYEMHIGPIPEGLVIDHLCRVRHCVNPAHLEVVTRAENNRRGLVKQRRAEWVASRTHCKHGHELTPENVIIRKQGWRRCRACEKARNRGATTL